MFFELFDSNNKKLTRSIIQSLECTHWTHLNLHRFKRRIFGGWRMNFTNSPSIISTSCARNPWTFANRISWKMERKCFSTRKYGPKTNRKCQIDLVENRTDVFFLRAQNEINESVFYLKVRPENQRRQWVDPVENGTRMVFYEKIRPQTSDCYEIWFPSGEKRAAIPGPLCLPPTVSQFYPALSLKLLWMKKVDALMCARV